MKYPIPFILLLLLSPFQLPLYGQGTWQTPLPERSQSAYHNVFLSPEVTCRLAPQGGNVRIIGPNQLEAPYLLSSSKHVDQTVDLKWYRRAGERYRRRWYSRSIFENPRKNAIDEMVLKVRNADVSQRFWLSGSDDGTHWYIIKEDYSYESAYDPSSTYNLLTLKFPKVDYRYYKVELKHVWREPIDIMGAGYYDVRETGGHYQIIDGLSVTQSNDTLGKQSYIEIDLGQNHYLDRIHFTLDGPEMYHRQATLEVAQGDQYRTSLALSSEMVPQVQFDRLRASKLRLTIDNKDDQPIRIAGVRAYQLKRSLTVKLDKTKAYQLVIGNETQTAPEYDLVHFRKQIPQTRPQIRVDSLAWMPDPVVDSGEEVVAVPFQEEQASPSPPAEPEKETQLEEASFFKSKTFLWLGIGVILVAMTWFSIAMLKDKPTDENVSP